MIRDSGKNAFLFRNKYVNGVHSDVKFLNKKRAQPRYI